METEMHLMCLGICAVCILVTQKFTLEHNAKLMCNWQKQSKLLAHSE